MIETQNLTETELEQNYNEFIDLIKKSFKGDRLEKLLHMYSEKELGLRLTLAPASAKKHFHCAWVGGLILHTNHVVNNSQVIKKLFKLNGGDIDFTDEELIFSCIMHDLGKVGDESGQEYYLPQDEDWKSKRGEIFKFNPKLQFQDITDRSLFLLQHYDIKTTLKESLAIKLSDGMFVEKNKSYYVSYDLNFQLKTTLPYIVHWSDWISCQSEHSLWLKNQN